MYKWKAKAVPLHLESQVNQVHADLTLKRKEAKMSNNFHKVLLSRIAVVGVITLLGLIFITHKMLQRDKVSMVLKM